MSRIVITCPNCRQLMSPKHGRVQGQKLAFQTCLSCGHTFPFEQEIAPRRLSLIRGASTETTEEDMPHPFEFPLSGTIRTGNPVVGVSLIDGQREVVFSSPQGTHGVVRNLSFIAAAITDGTTDSCEIDITVEITYGGESSPRVSVPLMTLVGMEHHDFALPDLSVSTQAFELSAGNHQGSAPWAIKFGVSGNWRIPIPYTNGITIEFVAGSDTVLNTVFCNTIYQDALPQCWNRNFKFCASRSNETLAAGGLILGAVHFTDSQTVVSTSGSFPANTAGKCLVLEGASLNDLYVLERTNSTTVKVSSRDGDHATIGVDSTAQSLPVHTFLSIPAGKAGYLLMVTAGVENASGDADFVFEGNVRYFLNGEVDAALVWSSVEDWAMGSYYFEQANRVEEGGIMAKDLSTTTVWSVYKIHYKHPVRFANGFVGKVPQYSTFGSTKFNWTSFYFLEN